MRHTFTPTTASRLRSFRGQAIDSTILQVASNYSLALSALLVSYGAIALSLSKELSGRDLTILIVGASIAIVSLALKRKAKRGKVRARKSINELLRQELVAHYGAIEDEKFYDHELVMFSVAGQHMVALYSEYDSDYRVEPYERPAEAVWFAYGGLREHIRHRFGYIFSDEELAKLYALKRLQSRLFAYRSLMLSVLYTLSAVGLVFGLLAGNPWIAGASLAFFGAAKVLSSFMLKKATKTGEHANALVEAIAGRELPLEGEKHFLISRVGVASS